jgi:hypothetical protein
MTSITPAAGIAAKCLLKLGLLRGPPPIGGPQYGTIA